MQRMKSRKNTKGEPELQDGFTHIRAPLLESALNILARLSISPPQVLLMEGGNDEQRHETAKYWAAIANCEKMAAPSHHIPCLVCNSCRQIGLNQFMDLHIFDGRIANAEDEENPGPIKALNMRRMRELKSMLATAPHGNGKRVVILQGLSINRDNAANALLKVLEEPSPGTLFVLLTPQREQLLPTLVSRSFVLTLPWEDPMLECRFPFYDEVTEFFATGKNFLEKISLKDSLHDGIADQIIAGCQKTLMHVLAGTEKSSLEKYFAKARDAQIAANISRWLGEARQMLQYSVSPARVLEGLFTRLFCILH